MNIWLKNSINGNVVVVATDSQEVADEMVKNGYVRIRRAEYRKLKSELDKHRLTLIEDNDAALARLQHGIR